MDKEVYASVAKLDKVVVVFGDDQKKIDDNTRAEFLNLNEQERIYFLPYTLMPGDIEAVNFFSGASGSIAGFSVMKSTINVNDECDKEIETFLQDEIKNISDIRKKSYEEYMRNNPNSVPNLDAAAANAKGAKWAGNFACFDCHIDQAAKWKNSEHSKAIDTLVAKDKGEDVECVGCHSVGFMDGGYALNGLQASRFAGVGCESCHGPGEWHRKMKTQAKNGDKPKDTDAVPTDWIPSPGAAVCTKCHQDMHDPDFDFATKIKMVACGKSVT
jgi:hypothetical protein